MKYFGISYKGRRETNQDSYYCGTINGYLILAVADGMGGQKGGEVASKIAIDCLINFISDQPGVSEDLNLKEILSSAYKECDLAIKNASESSENISNMGTTLSCVLMAKERYVVANIGDSRVYRTNNTDVECITKDHTYLQQYIEEFGQPIPDEVKSNGHVLTKALDGNCDEPDIFPKDESFYTAKKNDLLIVLSDGLILNKAEDFEIFLYQIAHGCNSVEGICKQLIANVYHRGTQDNCTVVTGFKGRSIKKIYDLPKLEFPPHLGTKPRDIEAKKIKNSKVYFVLTVLILAVIAAFFFNYRESFTSVQNNKIVENKSMNATPQSKNSEELIENTEMIWERGFTNVNTNIPFYEGDQIAWYRPDSIEISGYEINVFQENNLIHSETTSQTSFILRDEQGYKDGKLLIEISAIKDGEYVRPTYNSQTTIIYNRN